MKEQIYETNDIYCACTLLCNKGFKLIGSYQKDNEIFFKIEYINKKSLGIWLEKYINNIAFVDMDKYRQNILILKQKKEKYA
jgi:hypothetical protein